MADYGASYTDKTITELDKEIQAVYKEAEKDIQKKMDDFNAKYKIKEQKYQQKVDSGQMTQEEFDRWKKGQVFQGQQWQAKKDQILDTMHHSNEIATKIINGQSQNIFMVNANYMSYDIEHGAGVNFGFGLYDQNTVANLIANDPKLLPEWKINEKKDYIWSQKKLNNAITQGIIQGESLDKISKRISDKLASTNENKMKTFARTAMTGAQNSGRQMQLENAKKLDIEVQKEWMATLDARTRDSHKDMDGEKVDVGKEFSNGLMYPGDPNGAPAETYNCFISETNIASDSEIIRSYKHYYSGKIVSIKSARGVNFSCTPNHPILTDRGWVAAKFLNKGDNLIVTSGVNNEVSRRNPNINHAFPRIDTIHELFYMMGGKRTSELRVNFHGDIPTAEVEIITQKGFLRSNFNTSVRKRINKFLFKYTNSPFMRKCSFMKHFGRIMRTTFSNIRRMSKAFSFISRSLCHSNIHRFGVVSDVNLSISEYPVNNLPTNPNFFGESLIGLTGKIFLDDIVSVDVSDFTGHVYNLQTKNNYYFVNNNTNNTKLYNDIFAIAHNCRCTMVSELKKYPSVYNRYNNETGERIKNMSYRDWEEAKKSGGNLKSYSIGKMAIGKLFDGLSQNGAYTKIHDIDTKLSNQFYKELQEMGKAYSGGAKPAQVWKDYLNDNLPDGVSEKKLEKIMAEYKTKASKTLVAPGTAQNGVSKPIKAPKTTETVKTPSTAKDVVKSSFKSTDEWIAAAKKNPDIDGMLKLEENSFKKFTHSEVNSLKTYTGSAYRRMNGYLRDRAAGMSEKDALDKSGAARYAGDIERCKNALGKSKLEQDLVLRRGTDYGDIAGLFMKGDFESNSYSLRGKSAEKLNEMFQGSVGEYAGFTSTSSQWDKGFDGEVECVILAPKGTQAASIMNISQFGTGEGETLLNAGTKVVCEKIEKSDGHFRSDIRVFLRIIS